jgi:cytidine deaminase
VAVWKGEDGTTKVLPPCGRCREFIRQIHQENLDTEVLLSAAKSVPLRELLPHHDWFAEVE